MNLLEKVQASKLQKKKSLQCNDYFLECFLPILESYKEPHSTGTTTHRNLPNGQFAQKPNILDVKIWQTSWAQYVPLKSTPTRLSQSRKYCSCGFVAVLGNILK